MNRGIFIRVLAAWIIALGGLVAHAEVITDVTAEWMAIAASSAREAKQSPEAAAISLRSAQEAAAAAAARARNGNIGGKEVSGAAAQRHDAAVAVAAFAVLQHLYPDQRESLETRLAVSFSRIPESAAKAEGAAIGRRVASEFVAAGLLAAGRR